MWRFLTALSQLLTLLSCISLRTLHCFLVLRTFDANFEENLLFCFLWQYSAEMGNKNAIVSITSLYPTGFRKMSCYIYTGRHHLRTMPRAICQANFIRSAGSNESQSSSHSSSVTLVEASSDWFAAKNTTIGISILYSTFSPASAWSFSCKEVEGWAFSSNASVFFPSASASYKKSFTNWDKNAPTSLFVLKVTDLNRLTIALKKGCSSHQMSRWQF